MTLSIWGFSTSDKNGKDYPKALVSLEDFKELIDEVEKVRDERLISLETFLKYSEDPHTIILDARSKDKFDKIHIKGAQHIAFTDFTQKELESLIPNSNTRILIYCNNNFIGDQINFASKVFVPTEISRPQNTPNPKERSMALNIPTFVNLYGYGYRNIYELDELIHTSDDRIVFSGSDSNP